MRAGHRGAGVLAVLVLIGAILGGILGETIASLTAFSGLAPYLVKTFPIIDIPPITVNLYVLRFTVGFALFPNLVSVIGMIAAVLAFRKL